MTHKKWMRDCIESCRCKGEIITSGAAEMLLEKFSEHMDDVVPASTSPHQHLVTDAEGKVVWEEKSGGYDAVIEIEHDSCALTYCTESNTRLVGMTHTELFQACLANKAPRILIRQEFFYGDGCAVYAEPLFVQAYRDSSSEKIRMLFVMEYSIYCMTLTNASIACEFAMSIG